ncbi:hypothetical protein EDB87DRAFT_1583212 [Lactarius vividus]|nr:hypothetical protein EDB87DRAFT_1583212 [Lactarius vividus]
MTPVLIGPAGPVAVRRAQIPSIESTIAERSNFSFESPSYDLRADMEEPNNDIDTETLQAQIDLAMAQTQNLIASWLPASSGSLTQSSSRAAEAEAELQALLRRPPRLGVGAPLPESHAPAQVRLVQKLQGGKKRARETANGAHADVVGVKKTKEGEEESSAEESRVGTIRKRTIVDPFEAAGKKGKKRRKEAEEIKEPTDEAAQAVHHMDIDEGTTAKPTPKKKKKKKKNLLPEGAGTVGLNGEPRSAKTHNAPVAQDEGPLTQPPLDDTAEGKKPLQQEFRDGASEASDTVSAPGISSTPPGQSFSGFPIQQSPISPFPTILNLTGPPSMAPEDTEGHPRKKRRRKRKKKKPAGDPL